MCISYYILHKLFSYKTFYWIVLQPVHTMGVFGIEKKNKIWSLWIPSSFLMCLIWYFWKRNFKHLDFKSLPNEGNLSSSSLGGFKSPFRKDWTCVESYEFWFCHNLIILLFFHYCLFYYHVDICFYM